MADFEAKYLKRKITVKHYLNERAKPELIGKECFYPLYIQIIVNAKKAQIKSRISEFLNIYKSDIERIAEGDDNLFQLITDGYFSTKLINKIQSKKIFPLCQIFDNEVAILKKILIYMRPFDNEKFTLFNFGNEYQIHTTEITKIIDDSIKESFLLEVKQLFLKSIDNDNKNDIYRLSDYFLHYIDWKNNFFNFYQSTQDIIPEKFKTYEDLLSNDLRISIKAYLAYKTKINIINRLVERREQGNISTLSFLDWQTSVKEQLFKEFSANYGEQKATEYIISLDNILKKVINFL